MSQRNAFARAWSFLDFKLAAKWTALVCAAGTGVLYIALLVLLALFTDLVITRGRIPAYRELPPGERDRFWQAWERIEKPDRRTALYDLTGSNEKSMRLTQIDEVDTAAPADQEELWRAYVFTLLGERVGHEAAVGYREQSNASVENRDYSLGVLPFVIDARDRVIGRMVAYLARWNHWMWDYGRDEKGNASYMAKLGLMAFGLALLRTLLMFIMRNAGALASVEAATRLRRAIYHHAFRLGTLAIRALGPSEAVNLFTRNVEAVHDALYARLTVTFREPFKFALLLAFALLVNFWLAIGFLFFALLVWLVGGQMAAYFRRKERTAAQRAAAQLALLQESMMMMRLVKCNLMELFNQARVERQLSSYARSLLKQRLGESIYWPLLTFMGMLAGVGLLGVAGLAVLDGKLEVPSAIVQITALVSLYFPLVSFLENRRFVKSGREAAEIIFKFLDRPGEVGQAIGAEALPAISRQVEFDDVSLREPGTGRMMLNGVTLAIPAGQRIAIVGPDEMEKHALVYLIPRFLDPTNGEIRIDQHNLRWVTLDSLRSQIALVMQHNLVFNDTVFNNIGCGATFTLPQVIEAAKVAHAHNFIQKLPQGYDTPIGELGHSLGIAEQFRVALARAILRDPTLYIIEEPSSYVLDDDAKALLDDTFNRVLPGRTVIFLPHRITTIRHCNKIYLLHKGKIEAAGLHRELLEQSELYQHLHYLEFNIFAKQM